MALGCQIDYADLRETLLEAKRVLERAIRSGSYSANGVHVTTKGLVWFIEPEELAGRPISIIGDIHGDTRTLRFVLGLTRGSFRIFLGDYVDRGPPEGQIETIYKLLRYLVMGAGVILLRGNHEPPKGLEPVPHDYPGVLAKCYGREKGRELYDESLEVFNRLPHALILEGTALLVHGGIPRNIAEIQPSGKMDKDMIARILGGDPVDLRIIEDILWSDPAPKERLGQGFTLNPRGAGILWSIAMTRRILNLTGTKVIIRGHETAMAGYKTNHYDKVLTLFTRVGAPYGNNRAAILYCDSVSRIVDGRGRINKKCLHVLIAKTPVPVVY